VESRRQKARYGTSRNGMGEAWRSLKTGTHRRQETVRVGRRGEGSREETPSLGGSAEPG
jgi:hypothetical protein